MQKRGVRGESRESQGGIRADKFAAREFVSILGFPPERKLVF